MKSYRILLCALGSLGDLHPFLALGQQLQARGHRVKVASLERYQQTICKLFAHARCVVHQGGVGTCGQALAAGVPALVVPYSHDQPDNALRLKRLGAVLVLARKAYRADRVAPLLEQLFTPQYTQQAQLAAQKMAREPGAIGAVEAIERFLLRWNARG